MGIMTLQNEVVPVPYTEAFWDKRVETKPGLRAVMNVDIPDPEAVTADQLEVMLGMLKSQSWKLSFVLDFGVGIGRLAGPLRSRCRRMEGIDWSKGMLKRARQDWPELQTRLGNVGGDFDALLLQAGLFTMAMQCAVGIHMPDEQTLYNLVGNMAEVARLRCLWIDKVNPNVRAPHVKVWEPDLLDFYFSKFAMLPVARETRWYAPSDEYMFTMYERKRVNE